MRVRNVDHFLVLEDLGHERPRVQVGGDGHAEPEDERIGVVLQVRFDGAFDSGVEGSREVGRVGFGEGPRDELVPGGVVLRSVDAWGFS